MKETLECASCVESSAGFSPNGDFSLPPEAPYFSRAENSLLGNEIQKRWASIDFVACGHTHVPVRERVLHRIISLNLGADYGQFRGVVYETDSRKIRWVGEPVPDDAA